jgi:hypothetical protein
VNEREGRLEWSDETPQQAGWWWCKDNSGSVNIFEVRSMDKSFMANAGEWEWVYLSHSFFDGAQWAGPIPEPRQRPVAARQYDPDAPDFITSDGIERTVELLRWGIKDYTADNRWKPRWGQVGSEPEGEGEA